MDLGLESYNLLVWHAHDSTLISFIYKRACAGIKKNTCVQVNTKISVTCVHSYLVLLFWQNR